MQTVELGDWQTVAKYAEDKGISKQAVYKRIKRGNMTVSKIGGLLLVYIGE